VIENSHTSTALSYADGLAKADAVKGQQRAVAVVGDGALTGGMSWVALNNIGAAAHRPVVVVEGLTVPLRVAVMDCVVNGPGEMHARPTWGWHRATGRGRSSSVAGSLRPCPSPHRVDARRARYADRGRGRQHRDLHPFRHGLLNAGCVGHLSGAREHDDRVEASADGSTAKPSHRAHQDPRQRGG